MYIGFTSSSNMPEVYLPWVAVYLSYRFFTKFLHAKRTTNSSHSQHLLALTSNKGFVSSTILADYSPFTMSEVRPGGDSSDSLAEMTEPQNLQKSESSAESLRQPYRDKRYVNHTDDNVQIFPDNEQQSKSQKQYSAYIRDTGTDNDQAADSEVVRSNNDTNAAFAAKVHIRQLFVGNVWFLYDIMHFRSVLFIFPI
jgi:hypothetical protein